MEIEIKTLLHDILNAVIEIEDFISTGSRGLETIQRDLKTRRAVERNIEIIGEAMNRILQKDEKIELSNSRKIVDTRNRIIHGYDTVSEEFLWSIVVSHLPILKEEVEMLLASH